MEAGKGMMSFWVVIALGERATLSDMTKLVINDECGQYLKGKGDRKIEESCHIFYFLVWDNGVTREGFIKHAW